MDWKHFQLVLLHICVAQQDKLYWGEVGRGCKHSYPMLSLLMAGPPSGFYCDISFERACQFI